MSYLLLFAQLSGMIASMAFFIQYLPQAWLNYQRKSVKGFSTLGIIIKLVGASFLLINALWSGEQIPVICYGLFNVLQHSIFMIQFYLYPGEDKKDEDAPASLPIGHPHYKPIGAFVTKISSTVGPVWLPSIVKDTKSHYLLWILFPLIPAILASQWPGSIAYTNSVKPICQVLSHIPQMIECLRLRTTLGISMSSQHLNLVGGVCGLLMCLVLPPISSMTYLVYMNSAFQAISIYLIAIYYREPLFPTFGKESPPLPTL